MVGGVFLEAKARVSCARQAKSNRTTDSTSATDAPSDWTAASITLAERIA
jgi:hypothetical protein